jgi:hypothetical protein
MLLLGALVGALLAALLFGVTSGIGAWYARSAHRVPLAACCRPGRPAVAAALFVAGLESALSNLGQRDAPSWPSLSAASLLVARCRRPDHRSRHHERSPALRFSSFTWRQMSRAIGRVGCGWALESSVILQVATVLGQTGANVLDAIGVGVIAGIVTAAIPMAVAPVSIRRSCRRTSPRVRC